MNINTESNLEKEINTNVSCRVESCLFVPQKNTSIELVGLCVSYNYLDTLQFMLPLNYNHFTHIYLVTQEDDIKTINFCKQFDNVEIVLFDFKNNHKQFDKYGALNKIQRYAYTYYPNSWYLIIDSDIILPNNFIKLLEQNTLNKECIYGGYRNNLSKLSDIYTFYNHKFNIDLHNFKLWKNDKMILGCFQLYKQHLFHPTEDYNNKAYGTAGLYDLKFTELFNQKEFLDILFLHLGNETGAHTINNWCGKITSFNIDVNINLRDLSFIYNNMYIISSPLTRWKNKKRSENWSI
jgi:hypothetical protein